MSLWGKGWKPVASKGCVKALRLTRVETVMVCIYCQLDKNHHGDEPIDVTVRDFLNRVNGGGEFFYMDGMG